MKPLSKDIQEPRHLRLLQAIDRGDFDRERSHVFFVDHEHTEWKIEELLDLVHHLRNDTHQQNAAREYQAAAQRLVEMGWTPPVLASKSANRNNLTEQQVEEILKRPTPIRRDEEGSALLDMKAPPRRQVEPDTRGIWGDTVPPAHDPVNSPSHYTDGGIEVIDYLKAKLPAAEFIGFLRGNALKYLSRAGKKVNAVEDYKKADWYSERLVETLTEKKE